MRTNHTDTSISVSWRGTLAADRYYITVTTAVSTSGIKQTYSINTEVPGNKTVIEYNMMYEDLLPEHNYSICVCQGQTVSSCINIQTRPAPPPPSPTSSLSTSAVNSTTTSNNSTLLGGVLGFIIALLVMLLIVAGVGLAYPRCIRSRVKDKRYLSK